MAATALGIELRFLDVRRADDLEIAFSAMPKEQALVVLPDPLHPLRDTQARLAALALQHRVPMIAPYRGNAEAGGRMSFGTNLPDLFRRAATYVDKILKGAKPADLPVEQPTKFELVINMKTARALGLTMPQAVLLQADEIIQ